MRAAAVGTAALGPLPPSPRPAPRARLAAVAAVRPPVEYAKPRMNWPAIAAIIAFHAVLIGILVTQTSPLRVAKAPSAITVEIVRPVEPPKPPPPPPKRTPLPARMIAPQAVVAPPPVIVPDVPRAQDLPTITLPPAPPDPVPQPAVPAPAAPVAAAPAPEPLVPPRFDAAYLDNPPPAYPAMARRLREEGRVLLRVLVTADGRAGSIEVATSSGSERLDQAALDAVRRWRFVPAKRGDAAVAAHVFVPISFALESR